MKRNDPEGIDERAYRFYCDVVAFVETVPIGPTTSRIIGQLLDAAGSIGSNREEALSRSSNREVIHFNEISLRGASDSVRWLRACVARDDSGRRRSACLWSTKASSWRAC